MKTSLFILSLILACAYATPTPAWMNAAVMDSEGPPTNDGGEIEELAEEDEVALDEENFEEMEEDMQSVEIQHEASSKRHTNRYS